MAEEVAQLEQSGSGRRRRAKSRAADSPAIESLATGEALLAGQLGRKMSVSKRSRRASRVPQIHSETMSVTSDTSIRSNTGDIDETHPIQAELAMIATGLAEKDPSSSSSSGRERRKHKRRDGDEPVPIESKLDEDEEPSSAKSGAEADDLTGPSATATPAAGPSEEGGGGDTAGPPPAAPTAASGTGAASGPDRTSSPPAVAQLRLQVNMPPISIKQHFEFRSDQKVGDCMEKVVLTTPLLGKDTAWGLFLLQGQQMPYHSRLGDFDLQTNDTVELRVSEMSVPAPWSSLQQHTVEKKSGRKAVTSFFNTLRRKKDKLGLHSGSGDDGGKSSPRNGPDDDDDGAGGAGSATGGSGVVVGGPGDAADSKWTPVIEAASKSGDEDPGQEALRAAVEQCGGAEAINCSDGYGKTPLRAAAFAGNLGAVRYLLDAGASATIDRKDNNGWTALHAAAQPGHWRVCELLLAAGAVPCEPFAQATSPLHFLARHHWDDEVSPRVLELIVKSRQQAVNAINRQSETPLFEACSNSNMKVVEFLLAHGANVNRTNIAGETALHAAARAGCEAAVSALLDRGVSRDVEGDNGTALDIAKSLGRKQVITLLLQAAAPEAAAVQQAARVMHVAATKSAPSLLSPRATEVELADMCPVLASLVKAVGQAQKQQDDNIKPGAGQLVLSAEDVAAALAAGSRAAEAGDDEPAAAAAAAGESLGGADNATAAPTSTVDAVLARRWERRAARHDLTELARKKNELPEFLASLKATKSSAPIKTHLGLGNVCVQMVPAAATSSNRHQMAGCIGCATDSVAPLFRAPRRSPEPSVFRAVHRDWGVALTALVTPVRRLFDEHELETHRNAVSQGSLSSKAAAKDPDGAVDSPFALRTFSVEVARMPPNGAGSDKARWHQVSMAEHVEMSLAVFLGRRDCVVVAKLTADQVSAAGGGTAGPGGTVAGASSSPLVGVGGVGAAGETVEPGSVPSGTNVAQAAQSSISGSRIVVSGRMPVAANAGGAAGGGGGGGGGGGAVWGRVVMLRVVVAVARGWRRWASLGVQPNLSLTSGLLVSRIGGSSDLAVKVAPWAVVAQQKRYLVREFAKIMYALAHKTADLSAFGDSGRRPGHRGPGEGDDGTGHAKPETGESGGVSATADGGASEDESSDGFDDDDDEIGDGYDDEAAPAQRPSIEPCDFVSERWWPSFVALYDQCLSADPPSMDRICARLLAMLDQA